MKDLKLSEWEIGTDKYGSRPHCYIHHMKCRPRGYKMYLSETIKCVCGEALPENLLAMREISNSGL